MFLRFEKKGKITPLHAHAIVVKKSFIYRLAVVTVALHHCLQDVFMQSLQWCVLFHLPAVIENCN